MAAVVNHVRKEGLAAGLQPILVEMKLQAAPSRISLGLLH